MLPRTQLREIIDETTYDVPTTEYWRALMRRARKSRKITQVELATRLGVSQAILSDVETGNVAASRVVPAVCAALEIPLPWILVEDEWDERWCDVGRLLRRHRPEYFRAQLAAYEALAGDSDEPDA